MRYREFMRVPEEIYADYSNREIVLPLFLYIYAGQDKMGVCRTTMADLLVHCGHKITTGRATYNKIEDVKDALEYLSSKDLISNMSDIYGVNIERDSVKINDLICISILGDYINSLETRYTTIYTEDYKKFIRLCMENLGTKNLFWKSLTVYISISSRMWKRGKHEIYNDDITTIKKHPEFYSAHMSKIVDNLGHDGFSLPTVREILKKLESYNLIHYEAPGIKFDTGDGEAVRKIGTVFVLHSDNWRFELDCAKDKAIQNYKSFYESIIARKET